MLRSTLAEAWAAVPAKRKAELSQSVLAERILRLAAAGVRDPVRLRNGALVEIAE